MFIIEKIIILFQERWKYFLLWYMIGYFIAIMQGGVLNVYYLIPLKPFAIAFGWACGNVHYKVLEERKRNSGARLPMYMHFYHGVKYGIPALIFTIIYCVLIVFIGSVFKFDSTPFLAPFKFGRYQ